MNRTEPAPFTDPREDVVAAIADACRDVGARATDRLAAAHDASHYLLTPQAVATAQNAGEVAQLFAAAQRTGVPVTFRSGGTSLSGQAGTDGILIDTRKHFRGIEVLDNGARVRVEPGATVRAVNAALAPYGRILGPDPASEIACTIGGVVANNSSGMACGTHANTYQTLDSAVLVLPSGTVLDTAEADADERLRQAEPQIYDGLVALRERVRSNPASRAQIETLYSIKNTMGYGLNSFVDHTRPVDILEHLVVGSEGTLAFVASATFRTLPIRPHVATSLLVFDTLAEATAALPALVDAGFATIELLDAASLRVAQADPQAVDGLRNLQVDDHAALLVELQETDADALAARRTSADATIGSLPLFAGAPLTIDPVERAKLWHVRKGLFAAVASARPVGTSSLLEDVAVPVSQLNRTCKALTELFTAHGYGQSVIFGHAKDGNIHFLISERFDDPVCLERYRAFTEDMVDLVLAHGGTLKAEHGTGRTMAPFVRRQYGDELYEVMWELKRLIDPTMSLNPGVILSADAQAHTNNLKTSPPVDDEIERCVECGYCEPVCPSRDLTLTPRDRIVLRRERQRAADRGDEALVAQLDREYRYDGVQTCAVDGMCQVACPVQINTGDLVQRLRAEDKSRWQQAVGVQAAKHADAVATAGSAALSVAKLLPTVVPKTMSTAARAVGGKESVPAYSGDLPTGGSRRNNIEVADPDAIYFLSCTNTLFGPAEGDGVAASFFRVCAQAGVTVSTPEKMPSLCCATPWKSKGYSDGYAQMAKQVAVAVRRATRNGQLPLVCDASSCTEGLQELLASASLAHVRVLDVVEFVDQYLLDKLPPVERVTSVTVHPTCSSTQLGINDALVRVAEAAADQVVLPEPWGCCGFAGDRGMLHPELTEAATAPEAQAVGRAASEVHASLNRTCELGMTRATGQPYRHIVQVLDDALSKVRA